MKNAVAKKPSGLSKVLGGCAAVALTLTSLAGGAYAVAADESDDDAKAKLSAAAENLEPADQGGLATTAQVTPEALPSDGGG